MGNQEFGARIRELRKKTGISQRELASRIGIDFTYLSKMENGLLPPPSERVLEKLVDELKVSEDELLTLAGRIPSDIVELLKDPKVLERLRAQKEKAAQPVQDSRKPATKARNSTRIGIAVVLVAVIGTLLWFAAPTKVTAVEANNQGVAYNNQGKYLKAIDALNQAIELDPKMALAYNNRGWSYLGLGQYEQAITDCTKAIDLDPRLALAYSNRGLAYVKLSHYEQALADCDQAIELNPYLALAYSNRGQAYIGLGKYKEAIADFDKAIQLDPSIQKK